MTKKGINVQVIGAEDLSATLRAIPGKATAEVKSELQDILNDLTGKAQLRAPIDLADLRGSAFNELVGFEGTVGFEEPYAMIQHEAMHFHHPKGGEAKYLENPLKENSDMYIQSIGDAVKRAVE